MDKARVNMTNWQLYVYNEEYTLSGRADRHPELGKDAYIYYSSKLVAYSFENDVLTYETQNTIYICPLKYMSASPYIDVVDKYREQLTHRADTSDDILDRIIAATAKLSMECDHEYYRSSGKSSDKEPVDHSDDELLTKIKSLQKAGQEEIEQMRKQEQERLINIVNQYENSIYLEVSNIGGGNTLAYHLGEYSGVVYPSVHSGMYKDSVLYMKYTTAEDPCSLDFRYFPDATWYCMETYSWSDNIAQAVIMNDTGEVLTFNKTDIPAGELKIFTPDTHREGLISPDCHNGKSVFFDPGKK